MVYTVIALFPIFMIVMNSFKAKKYIFGSPFALPTPTTFDLIGYETVIERSHFGTYFYEQPDCHPHIFGLDTAHRRDGCLCAFGISIQG